MELDLELSGHPDSVGEARRAVSTLRERVPAQRLDDLRLLVSEVVTNAIRHSGAGPGEGVGLRIVVTGSTVRVEVRDRGPGFIFRRASPDPARASGWGLYLVAELADRWGIEDEKQTCVWFELT
jgi:anti-sigma regulatory factor (Ser/Thr protein kinase)